MHSQCETLLEEARLAAIESRVYIPNDLIGNIEAVDHYSIQGNGKKYFVSACCIERATADYIFELIDDANLKHIQG